MLDAVNQNLRRFTELREIHIPNDVSPLSFQRLVPGMTVVGRHPFRMSTPAVKRQCESRDVAFWPVVQLANSSSMAGDVAGADRSLSRTTASPQPDAGCAVSILDDLARLGGAGRREPAGKCEALRRSLGRQGHHRGQGLQDHLGLGASRIR